MQDLMLGSKAFDPTSLRKRHMTSIFFYRAKQR